MATQRRINSWCTQCHSPTSSSERKDFVANTPTLHIKLELAKQFVKALKSGSEAFKDVKAMFPKLSEAKVKGGIFTGSQIRQMLGSKELEGRMTALERDA